jgi:outer membrane protein OmpA-like peptidoglycan-associated protein
MNKKILITISYLIFYNLTFAVFEDLDVTVRGKILGEGYIANCEDVGAIYYNPSFLGSVRRRNFCVFYHNIYNLNLLNNTFVGYVHPRIGKGGVGFGWVRMGTTNDVDFMKYSENKFIFSYGKNLIKNIYIGGNLKYLFVDYDYKASGYSIDLGLTAKEVLPWLNLGIDFQNLFSSDIVWQTGNKENLNLVTKFGVDAYYKSHSFYLGMRYEDNNFEPSIGWEFSINNYLTLLSGVREIENSILKYLLGFYVNFKNLRFAYGVEFHNSLGTSYFLSVCYVPYKQKEIKEELKTEKIKQKEVEVVVVDNTPPSAELGVSSELFEVNISSPAESKLYFDIYCDDDNEVGSWELKIYNEVGNVVKTFSGKGKTSQKILWDGCDELYSKTVPEGVYTAKLVVVDNFNNTSSVEKKFEVKHKKTLEVLIKEIPKEIKVKEEEKLIRVQLQSQVLFEFGKYELMPQSKKILQNVVELLKAYPKNKILVEGHTDSVGSDEYNLKLSKLRAEEVKKFLVENGIEEERIEAKGYGKSKPIASNKTEQGRAQNRRVEILIFK